MSEYLDRKQVIDLYEKFQPSLAIHVYEFGEALRKLPVTQDSHGEWLQVTAKDGEYYCYHKCTNCGQTIESGFDNPPLFNFCPQCGADMRKEGEAE